MSESGVGEIGIKNRDALEERKVQKLSELLDQSVLMGSYEARQALLEEAQDFVQAGWGIIYAKYKTEAAEKVLLVLTDLEEDLDSVDSIQAALLPVLGKSSVWARAREFRDSVNVFSLNGTPETALVLSKKANALLAGEKRGLSRVFITQADQEIFEALKAMKKDSLHYGSVIEQVVRPIIEGQRIASAEI